MLAGQVTGTERHGDEQQGKHGRGGGSDKQIELMPLVQRLHFISLFRRTASCWPSRS